MTLLLTPRLLVRALKSLARKRETVFHQKKRGRGVRKKLRAAVSANTSTRKYTLAPFSKIWTFELCTSSKVVGFFSSLKFQISIFRKDVSKQERDYSKMESHCLQGRTGTGRPGRHRLSSRVDVDGAVWISGSEQNKFFVQGRKQNVRFGWNVEERRHLWTRPPQEIWVLKITNFYTITIELFIRHS